MNVILYGVGSKKSLLQRFLAETLQDEYSWEIHGYKPRFDLEEVSIYSITEVQVSSNSFLALSEFTQLLRKDCGSRPGSK